MMASTVALTGIFLSFLKTYPPPPLAALGQLQNYNTQWPSGHSAVQMSVALGMILWWWGAGLPRPSIVAGIVTPIAVLVGYSRAFLGIHWLSEVLGLGRRDGRGGDRARRRSIDHAAAQHDGAETALARGRGGGSCARRECIRGVVRSRVVPQHPRRPRRRRATRLQRRAPAGLRARRLLPGQLRQGLQWYGAHCGPDAVRIR